MVCTLSIPKSVTLSTCFFENSFLCNYNQNKVFKKNARVFLFDCFFPELKFIKKWEKRIFFSSWWKQNYLWHTWQKRKYLGIKLFVSQRLGFLGHKDLVFYLCITKTFFLVGVSQRLSFPLAKKKIFFLLRLKNYIHWAL